jgi:pimeloyl-ACP methyl ester carboxylesterase
VRKLAKAEEVKIRAKDGFIIHASYWKGKTPKAPAVLLAHSLAADRHEWDPVLQRLDPQNVPMSIVAVDLRGHGQSVGKKNKTTWQGMNDADFKKLSSDMIAVMAWLDKRPGGAPSALVLAGSDVGGSALVRAADERPKGACIAGATLVSPGAKLRGIDVYRPFRVLMDRPVLLVASASDTISNEPVNILGKMGHETETIRFEGSRHGLGRLSGANERVWDDLAYWITDRVKGGCTK